MPLCCYCGQVVAADNTGPGSTCGSCGKSVHSCRNCRHFEPSVPRKCSQDGAPLVLDKESENSCDYFAFGRGGRRLSGFGAGASSYEMPRPFPF